MIVGGNCLFSRLKVGFSRFGVLIGRLSVLFSHFGVVIGRLSALFSRFKVVIGRLRAHFSRFVDIYQLNGCGTTGWRPQLDMRKYFFPRSVEGAPFYAGQRSAASL